MASIKQILTALVGADHAALNETLTNLRETLNTINSIDIEQIERVGEAARKTIAVLNELEIPEPQPAPAPSPNNDGVTS